MAFIRVHGLKLANGAYIQNAVFESVTTPLTQTEIDASAIGRTYFDVTSNSLMSIISDGQGGKTVRSAGSLKYEPNLTSKILSGATSYQNADDLLEGAIEALQAVDVQTATDIAGLKAADTQTATDIAELKAADTTITGNVTQLRTDVDSLMSSTGALSFTYKSTAPATEHTITHNLNAEFVDASVWVKDADTGLYSLDLVNTTEIDANTIKVTLSGSYDIKTTVRRANASA